MNPTYYGAIVVLNATPDADTAKSIADDLSAVNFPHETCHHTLTRELPKGTPQDVVNNYTKMMEDLSDEATYLLVYPVEDTNTSS